MRIGLIQLNAKIGDFENNRLNIQRLAESVDADLYLCPELCLSGYHARDLFTRKEFVDQEQRHFQRLCDWSQKTKKHLWVGHIVQKAQKDGLHLYNGASLIAEGKVVTQVLKRKLPNYNVFEELRYFSPAPEMSAEVQSYRGYQVHLDICEDSWSQVQRFSLDEWRQYTGDALAWPPSSDPRLLLNLSASPFVAGKFSTRRQLLKDLAQTHQTHVAYVNFVGAQDELVFDGQSSIYAPNGTCLLEAPAQCEGIFVTDLAAPAIAMPPRNVWMDIHQSLCAFIRDYVRKSGFQKVLLGLSGGIDSALVAALCVDALGPENVLGVGLESEWTSKLSKDEAALLAKNLGISYDEYPITPSLKATTDALKNKISALTLENMQSRLRGLMLMSLANDQNRLLIATSNKSELAMGYSTIYGDMCGSVMPIGDLYKTEVFGLAHYLNRMAGSARIPALTLSRPPSAELSADQKDSDSLPEYSKLDGFLEMCLEHRERLSQEMDSWDKLLKPHSCANLMKRIQINEFKRSQAPLICKVHHRSFGKHWNMPLSKAATDLPKTVS